MYLLCIPVLFQYLCTSEGRGSSVGLHLKRTSVATSSYCHPFQPVLTAFLYRPNIVSVFDWNELVLLFGVCWSPHLCPLTLLLPPCCFSRTFHLALTFPCKNKDKNNDRGLGSCQDNGDGLQQDHRKINWTRVTSGLDLVFAFKE